MATAESRPHPTNLWTDVQLQRLPGDVRRMLDYLMTGPDVNAAGVTQIEDGVIAARIGFHQLTVDTTIQILANHGEVYVDWETREAWPVRWARFHKFEKAIAVKAFSKGMLDIKSSELKRLISGKIQLKQGASRQQQQQHQHQHQQRESSGSAAISPVDNVNNVFIKAAEAAAPAAVFNIKSTSHPKTCSALASLASTNHLAKPNSVLAKTEQSIRRALAAAKGLTDEQAAGIVDALAEEGGWVSSAAARLANAAKQIGAGQARLAVKAVAEQAAAVGLDPAGKRWAGRTVRLPDGAVAKISPAGTVRIAGKLILADQLATMLDDGRLKLVEGEPNHPPPRGLAQLQLSQPSP